MQTIIESYLAQYPSIQMVLDVHRDAVEDRAGFPAALTANIDGEEYARLMLVVGTDEYKLTEADLAMVKSANPKATFYLDTENNAICIAKAE